VAAYEGGQVARLRSGPLGVIIQSNTPGRCGRHSLKFAAAAHTASFYRTWDLGLVLAAVLFGDLNAIDGSGALDHALNDVRHNLNGTIAGIQIQPHANFGNDYPIFDETSMAPPRTVLMPWPIVHYTYTRLLCFRFRTDWK